MTSTIPFRLDDGSTISVVIDPDLEEEGTAGGSKDKTELKLRESIDKIGKILPDIEKSLMDIRKKVSATEISIEFGVTLNSNGSIIIVSTGVQASFNISVTWAISNITDVG